MMKKNEQEFVYVQAEDEAGYKDLLTHFDIDKHPLFFKIMMAGFKKTEEYKQNVIPLFVNVARVLYSPHKHECAVDIEEMVYSLMFPLLYDLMPIFLGFDFEGDGKKEALMRKLQEDMVKMQMRYEKDIQQLHDA